MVTAVKQRLRATSKSLAQPSKEVHRYIRAMIAKRQAGEDDRCGHACHLMGVTMTSMGIRGRPRSEVSHQAVMEATAQLLRTVPYEDLTVERIAAAAGVGKQTIYRWWKNKAAVVLEAMLTGQAEIDIVSVGDTGDLRADLLTWIYGMLDEAFRPSHISMARSLVAAALQGDPATEELLSGTSIWDTGKLVERLHAAQKRGEIRSDVELSAIVAALGDPLILRMLTGHRPPPMWAETLVDVVVEGLRS